MGRRSADDVLIWASLLDRLATGDMPALAPGTAEILSGSTERASGVLKLYPFDGLLGPAGHLILRALEAGAFGDDGLIRSVLDGCPELPDAIRPMDEELRLWEEVAMAVFTEWLPFATPGFPRPPKLVSGEMLVGEDRNRAIWRFQPMDYGITTCREFVLWLVEGTKGVATWIRKKHGPLVLTRMQRDILKALDGRALKKADLAEKVCGSLDYGNLLYRKSDLKELRAHGRVRHKPGLGFYRPDAPPEGMLWK